MTVSIGLTDAISRQDWLNPAEETLQKTLHRAFESGGEAGVRIKDALHGTWIGHPLHVILTDIPLGAWTSAMVFDAVAAISDIEWMDSAADACIGVGLAGAILAAITGLTDWQDIDPPARRVGLVHGLMNLTAAALMGTSLLTRRREMRASGKGLGLLGFLVATLAARLGGNLVYEHRIGVDRSAEKNLPQEFRRAAAAADLEEGKPLKVSIDDTPIVLIKSGVNIFALAETCSHLGGPLAEGKVEGGTIQCPWHSSRFDLKDGSVVNGPAVHPQRCLEVRLTDGQVEVRRRELQAY
jgi:nitrite reductase/ring-hydroxylating ferredoxin subunit/uncharacterized membrane protein